MACPPIWPAAAAAGRGALAGGARGKPPGVPEKAGTGAITGPAATAGSEGAGTCGTGPMEGPTSSGDDAGAPNGAGGADPPAAVAAGSRWATPETGAEPGTAAMALEAMPATGASVPVGT